MDQARQHAMALLAEARNWQSQGRLIEARQKAIEAQNTYSNVADEDVRPDRVLLELMSLCDKRIANLLQHASDCMADAAGNPSFLQSAADDLDQAKKLSVAFGYDTARVDSKLAMLDRSRGTAGKGPGLVVANSNQLVKAVGEPGAVKTDHKEGLELLDKARLELRAGQTISARKLAAAAFNKKYGVQQEAGDLLRSIDIEEFNRKIQDTNHAADAGVAAYNRRDYAHAARIFETIDVRMLSEDRKGRVRELMMMPEMQPDAVARKGSGATVLAKGGADASKPPTFPLGNPPGKAKVSDLPGNNQGEDDPLAKMQAMQEVKLQEMHQQARQAQREAMARFQAGDTSQALEILQAFIENLKNSDLDESRIALLKRPVEERLQRLRNLKAQRDFDKQQVTMHQSFEEAQRHDSLIEEQRKQKVAELMKLSHTFYQEGKYNDAMVQAEKALELDPENVAASAAKQIAELQRNVVKYKKLTQEKNSYFVDAMDSAETSGPYVGDLGISVDKEKAIQNRKRRPDTSLGISSPTKNSRERLIEQQLYKPVTLNFKDTPLSQVIQDLKEMSGVNVVADKSSLEEAGILMDKPLDLQVENISLKSALNILLQQIHLTYVVKDEVLLITTEDNAKGKLKRVTYPVADLVVPVDNQTLPVSASITKYLDMHYSFAQPQWGNGSTTPYTGPNSMYNGTTVSTPSGSAGVQASAGSTGNPLMNKGGMGQTIEDTLIKLITTTVAPESWNEVGGKGTIQYYPLGLALIINQTPDIQEQVQDLLAALRRLQDLEVAIEMRLVAVSESFFERIGLDFNVNIVNHNHKYDNNLINGQFQPFGFINKFTPAGFFSGLTPANTLTPDLGIPLRQDSFAFTPPPFGYPGVVGADGGLSLGLAFLSDIQVFMFMEAAQGDRRLNVMQAPKLTMFNGQTATLTVLDSQFFLTSVIPQFTPSGQLFFTPVNMPVPLGVALTVQPVISGDRRFVRMNLAPNLVNLASTNVPLVPIQIPIPQVFAGGVAAGTPEDQLFQIFLQQPAFTTISIMTTVSVPDGGTVLLGGLKTLSEGRNEFGPPILSKIPYINRLFKNVGYGREAQSLLIMVTPRIIINAEEEERAVGLPAEQGP
jgi:type II secretory pathway component GspD/PulD (secretin)